MLVVRLLLVAAADGLRRVAAAEGGGRRADAFTFGGTRRPWPVGLRVGGRFCCVGAVVGGRGMEGGGMREGLFVVGEVIVGALWFAWSEDLSGSCRLSSGTCTTVTVAEAFGVDCAESVSWCDEVSALFSGTSSGFACVTSGCRVDRENRPVRLHILTVWICSDEDNGFGLSEYMLNLLRDSNSRGDVVKYVKGKQERSKLVRLCGETLGGFLSYRTILSLIPAVFISLASHRQQTHPCAT